MKTTELKIKFRKNISVLAVGPESAGNFSVFQPGKIYFSSDFGDLLDDKNFADFQKEILYFLQKNKIKPKVILTDLHPLYRTTVWGRELAKKFKAEHIKIQHHLAHIFSAYGESLLKSVCRPAASLSEFYGIACDGTGYGLDGKIWGGEIFKIKTDKLKIKNIERAGHLENQILIGGDLAIKEPARMLISILSKFLDKKDVYNFVKKIYNRNQFELLYNQLKQNFNCQETSSVGRILDAVSVLLGFSGNKRNYKHEPIDLLEKNSSDFYKILPKVKKTEDGYQLLTTSLFEYLIKNLGKDKQRLAATAQIYIAKGLYQIISSAQHPASSIYFGGGMANNKIISSYLESKGVITNKKIPRGDAGLSFGQIIFYLLTDPRN
jgi:hydrogenase maturation protein HypF